MTLRTMFAGVVRYTGIPESFPRLPPKPTDPFHANSGDNALGRISITSRRGITPTSRRTPEGNIFGAVGYWQAPTSRLSSLSGKRPGKSGQSSIDTTQPSNFFCWVTYSTSLRSSPKTKRSTHFLAFDMQAVEFLSCADSKLCVNAGYAAISPLLLPVPGKTGSATRSTV